MENTNVIYQLKWLEEETIVSVKRLVSENIETKMDSFIKKIISNHPEAKITFEVKINKQKTWLYAWVFTISYPWDKEDLRYEREDFEELYDLINHAFANFKERLSD